MMPEWLSKNLRTFGLAFVLAVAVWVSAVTASDPDETRAYPSLVPIHIIGQDPSLVIVNDYPPSLEVVLRAPGSIWQQLTADESLVRAEVDISRLAAGEHQVPIQVQVAIQPVRIISTTRQLLTIELEPLAVKTLPVNISLVGTLAMGYQAQEMELDPGEVLVSGPKSLMDQVAKVAGILDINSVRQDVDRQVKIQVLDKNGIEIQGLTLVPEQIHVNLPVIQQGGYRDLAVKVVVTGRVANGYRLTSILVNPPVITVYSSDIALIDSLPGYVETSQLNLNGVSADIETRLALNLPAGVSLLGDQDVLVQVGIAPMEGSMTMSGRPISVEGLADNLKATVSPPIVDLYLSGPIPLLDALVAGDVSVSVDVAGLVAGSYQLTPRVTLLLAGIRVESILPGVVEVILR